ncbi:Type 1 glutamine amidotransferase-like domain-containing protein [Kribbella sp. NPDC026611]|uniref:Type 1 glutamine amidotransferase-like domain-containing protein n=1 Tax=Kribbella sp. NPDC026611 TaxID=3154911 RepID=UPI0033F27AB7
MKLLLASAGIKNTSIANALVEMLGKPIAEASALVIPTAAYPAGGPAAAWRIVSGRAMTPLCEMGWKSLGVLELTALPSIDAAQWIPIVRETDALLVGGGDPLYLAHWLQESGAADVLPSLQDTVWVGVSAGSLVAAPHLGQDLSDWQSPTGSVEALGLVDFCIFPHLDNPNMPEFGLADAERWAAALRAGLRHRRPDHHHRHQRRGRCRLRGSLEAVRLTSPADLHPQLERAGSLAAGGSSVIAMTRFV